ncbi:DUF1349 domain-containing protein [Microbacter margulisiae]|uniref:DUF1349 domain-containing protein n=1 Tax=Microbacter margulisiae TaxID=1350067 RepID=A0A7W5DNX0_9PORP|nr:DUF1349 domain-containing protein [Microbacter margulisiae]MBB3186389.1 hypothetical protein [Microbacter margulisiae]
MTKNYSRMKAAMLILLLFGLDAFTAGAQEVKIGTIPYPMHFENHPVGYSVSGSNHLCIAAGPHTDLFIPPGGNGEINSSPRLVFHPDSDFILTAKVTPDFRTKWDAGVLVIYNDRYHYAKFCFEEDYLGQPRVVSVVCNQVADDCNSMAVHQKSVYYRVIGSSKGNTFSLYYSADGKSWYLVRAFQLDAVNHLMIGFSAQSSVGKGCNVDFDQISLQQRKANDFWKGN